MPTPEVRPMTHGGRAPKGRLTYLGILALIVFVILLAMAVIRPLLQTQSPNQPATPVAAGLPSGQTAPAR